MQTLTEIRTLLDRYGVQPKRRLGQNFLHDQNLIRKLVAAADIQPGECVLEVGPGTGALTDLLVERGADVIAVELDKGLAQIITDRLGGRITLVQGDCLQTGRRLSADVRAALTNRSFKLIANLPYQIASPLMTAVLTDDDVTCLGEYVTIQKEVADRLLATPGTKQYGPLGIIVRSLANVERLATLKPQSFWPNPKVTSAMVAITPKREHSLDDAKQFARFMTDLFTKRRKQLGSIFGRERDWPGGITPDLRPEALSIDQLQALWRSMARAASDDPPAP